MAAHTDPKSRRDRHELVATILLVVAAVATSWSSYQAARWHGEQATAAGRTSAIRVDAAREAGRANSLTQVDVATFIAWADADRGGDRRLADFYVERFRPEFAAAFEAWLKADPFTSATAPTTPFASPEYQLAARKEADQLDEDAEQSAAEVGRDIQIASNYVLTVVLYAVALFFAGMSTKLTGRRLRTATLASGCAVFAATVAWTATFPISIRI